MKKGFVLLVAGMLLLAGCQENEAQTIQSKETEQEVAVVPSEAKLVQSNETISEEKKPQVEPTYIEKKDNQVNKPIEQKQQEVKKKEPAVSFKQSVEIKPSTKQEEGKKKEEGKVATKPASEKKEEEQQQGILYRDKKHPFTVQLPATWSNNVEIKEERFDQHTQEAITFIVHVAGEPTRLASIFVFDSEEEAMSHIEFGLHRKLGEKDGLIYAYLRASEAPDKLYQAKYEKELQMVQKMMTEEVPAVMESFTLLP